MRSEGRTAPCTRACEGGERPPCARGASRLTSQGSPKRGERPSGTDGCVSLPSISGAFCGNPGGLANGVAGPRAASSHGVERSSAPTSRPHWPPCGLRGRSAFTALFFSQFFCVSSCFEESLRGFGSVWESGALGGLG